MLIVNTLGLHPCDGHYKKELSPRVSTICLPDVIACDQISQAFLSGFESDQRLDVGTAWEQDYAAIVYAHIKFRVEGQLAI